jgi:hypothetical protein
MLYNDYGQVYIQGESENTERYSDLIKAMDPLLTAKDLAVILKVHPNAVYERA